MLETIHRWLKRFLDSEISLSEFQQWFVPATWDVDDLESEEAQEFASEIALRLAEYTSGHLSESELQSELVQLREQYALVFAYDAPTEKRLRPIASSSFRTLKYSSAELRHQVAFA